MWAKDRNISHFLLFRYLIRVKSRLSFSNLELWMRDEREGDSSRFQFVIRILVVLNMKKYRASELFCIVLQKKVWNIDEALRKVQSDKKSKIHSWIRPHKFSDLQHRGWSYFVVNAFVWVKLRETSESFTSFCWKPQDTATVLDNEERNMLFRKVFHFLFVSNFSQFFLLLSPLLLFHSIEVTFNINNTALGLPAEPTWCLQN